MKKTLRFLAIILSLAIVLSLCGCGEKIEKDNGNNKVVTEEEIVLGGEGGSDQSGTSKSNVNIDMAKLKGSTVKMLMWRELNKAEKTVISNFEKSTGISVKYTVVNQKDYPTKVAAEIASSAGLDICAIQSGGMSITTKDVYASIYPVGTLKTMQPFFEVTGQDPNESIWAKSWMDPYKINGKYYGVAIPGGWNTLTTVIYYNKDMFEENGITTPKELWKANNWNWDTFKEVALKISNLGDYYCGYAGRDSYSYMLSSGVDYVSFNGKTFQNSMSDPKFTKAWEFYGEMISSGAQFKGDGSSNYPQLFLEGKFGMYGEGSYCMANIGMLGDYAYNLDDVSFEIDCVPFPSPKGEKATIIHRGNLFGIAKNSQNPVAAGVFLRFWLDPKNSLPFSKIAINNNMKDTFDYINNEGKLKQPFLSGGVVGYTAGIGHLSYITSRLLNEPTAQISSIIAEGTSLVDTAVEKANKEIS